jgi:hypothetical protein
MIPELWGAGRSFDMEQWPAPSALKTWVWNEYMEPCKWDASDMRNLSFLSFDNNVLKADRDKRWRPDASHHALNGPGPCHVSLIFGELG